MSKIRISAVSYTNTLPFLHGITASDLMDEIELSVDYPSECARKVIADESDMGIIPVAGLSSLDEYHIISDYCIGSLDYVDSVFIFSQKPIEEIHTLRLDKQSRTSNGLAQILLKRWWKKDVQVLLEGEADAFVLIGDRTFGKKNELPFSYDLGHYWKELTGLPFAYAVWASNKRLSDHFVKRFNQALAEGISRIEEVIPGLPDYKNFDYKTYLTENLDYHLTDKKREAIEQYLAWYQELSAIEAE